MKLLSTYKFKIVCGGAVILTLFNVLITWTGVRGISNAAITFYTEEGIRAVSEAKDCIEIPKWERLSKSLDSNDPYYADLNEFMYDVREHFTCEYLYTMAPTENPGEAVYVVDGSKIIDEEDEDFTPIGTIEDISYYGKTPLQALKTKEVQVTGLLNDENWGWNLTVYMPIINQNGNSIGWVAADFDATLLHHTILKQVFRVILISLLGETAALLLLGIIIFRFFGRIENVVNRMNEISGGGRDLTARLNYVQKNEIGALAQSCNDVISTIQEMVKTVSKSVTDLSYNSSEILDQSQKMVMMLDDAGSGISLIEEKAHAQTELVAALNTDVESFHNSIESFQNKVEGQVEAVNRSSSAVEQITANITSSDQNINRITKEYDVIVNDTYSNQQNQKNLSEQIGRIQEMAKNLSEANKIITNIASQTNLLAMNAAIEAAHAGEAGSGFSVVAEEIRNLAETSAEQTKSIKAIVTDIENAVGEMVNSSDKSEKAFAVLGEKVSSLQSSVQEIQRGMNEQASGAREILEMMKILNTASQEMSAASGIMNSKTVKISDSMKTISSSSSDILESTGNTSDKLKQIRKFAEEASQTSKNNRTLSDNVRSVVGSYKVE